MVSKWKEQAGQNMILSSFEGAVELVMKGLSVF
jgi:hypothetical protein